MAHSCIILVADDDPALAALLREILADEGYKIICCYSGTQALELIETETPDLAILDLQMEHETAGLAVIERLRYSSELRHMPVILYSAAAPRLATLKPRLEALQCVTLPKPFNIDQLLTTVKGLLHGMANDMTRERVLNGEG
jgi:DNA-binding response OmpR family regulator